MFNPEADSKAPLVRPAHPAILRKPLQFFPHFDLSVPRIIAQAMAFAREDQQFTGDIQFMQSAIEQVVLEHRHADIFRAADHVRRRPDFVDLKDCRFAAIAIGDLPGMPARK